MTRINWTAAADTAVRIVDGGIRSCDSPNARNTDIAVHTILEALEQLGVEAHSDEWQAFNLLLARATVQANSGGYIRGFDNGLDYAQSRTA